MSGSEDKDGGSEELRSRALAAQERLRAGLHDLAVAADGSLVDEVAAVEASLDEYDALLTEDRDGTLGWNADARERIARCRAELNHLVAGRAHRTDVIGMVRLVVPRVEKGGEA